MGFRADRTGNGDGEPSPAVGASRSDGDDFEGSGGRDIKVHGRGDRGAIELIVVPRMGLVSKTARGRQAVLCVSRRCGKPTTRNARGVGRM